jgi:hypothetical protein
MKNNLQIWIIDRHPVGWVAAFVALSWMGEYIHNRMELPQLSFLSPENSFLLLLAVILFILWWKAPGSRIPTILLLVLGTVHLVGGGISVFPFKFLPFYPEQSWKHYFTHILYGLAQLPLIIAMVWYVSGRSNREITDSR